MTIYLVRHGESTLNEQGIRHGREADAPITATGAAQAWRAGRALADLSRPVVLCSPLLRASQTAAVLRLAAGVKARPLPRPELMERAYDKRWLETCEEAASHAAALLAVFDRDVIAVTHAGVIKGLMGLEKTPPNGTIHEWRP